MNLEIGDIVDFDAILGGVKPYGINYMIDSEVNGQVFYPNFLITSTNKTLNFVEIECIQMHDLKFQSLPYTTFPIPNQPYPVIASLQLHNVNINNIYDDFPELENLVVISLADGSNSAIFWQGQWNIGLDGDFIIQGGESYEIWFSQETTTNLFQLDD